MLMVTFPMAAMPCLFEELSEQSIEFIRVVRDQEESPREVVRVHLERFDELVKVDLLAGLKTVELYDGHGRAMISRNLVLQIS